VALLSVEDDQTYRIAGHLCFSGRPVVGPRLHGTRTLPRTDQRCRHLGLFHGGLHLHIWRGSKRPDRDSLVLDAGVSGELEGRSEYDVLMMYLTCLRIRVERWESEN